MITKLFSIFKESSNSFEGQEEGEKVLLLIRRFPLHIILQLLSVALIVLIPLGAGLFFMPILANHDLVSLFWFAMSLWALLSWLGAFYALTMYTLDVWIVTDRRIIDGTQQGLFYRTVSELHLTRVQDISMKVAGPLQSFFYFGSLGIQTAGTEEHFKFREVGHPEQVKDTIMQAVAMQNKV